MAGGKSPPDTTPVDGAGDVVVAAQVADEHDGVAAAVAAQGGHVLIVARFADTNSAIAIHDQLVEMEIADEAEIDCVLVVDADAKGKLHVRHMTDHSTRTGLKWGIVGGVVAAVFLPATIVAGAVALGIAGAMAGKARNLYHRVEIETELAGVITPGTSGILCLVSVEAAVAVAQAMPDAQEVRTVPVDEETADAVKAAAAAAAADPIATSHINVPG